MSLLPKIKIDRFQTLKNMPYAVYTSINRLFFINVKNGKYTDKVEIVSSVKQLLCNSYSSTEILTLRPLTDKILSFYLVLFLSMFLQICDAT